MRDSSESPRLFDLIGRQRLVEHPYAPGWDMTDILRDALRHAELVVIDNVAEYFYAESPKDVWNLYDDFPAVAPPWPLFWMEHGRPSKIVEGGHVTTSGIPDAAGVIFKAVDYEQMLSEVKQADPADIEKRMYEYFKTHEDDLDLNAIRRKNYKEWTAVERGLMAEIARFKTASGIVQLPKFDGWMISAVPLLFHANRGIIAMASVDFQVGLNGTIEQDSLQISLPLPRGGVLNPEQEESMRRMGGLLNPFLLALSFLHCKNVEIKDVDRPCYRRERHRKLLPPLLKYHVLEIHPAISRLKSEGRRLDKSDLKMALHICRGHFKEYRDKGLFGKLKGLFWWDSHLRGSLEAGMVDKEYKVDKE